MSESTDLDPAWRYDGSLWWPNESADGRQRFNGQRWVTKRPGFRVLQVVSWILVAVSPLALLIGYGTLAGHGQYTDQPPVSGGYLVFAYLCYLPAPVGIVGVVVADRLLGSPGFGTTGRVRWVWTPPPGWPAPPPGWTPSAGWTPDPSWPPPPAEWRGWVRRGRWL